MLIVKVNDEICFTSADIDDVQVKFIPFTPCLQIRHHKKGVPEWVWIYTLDPNRLKLLIEEHLHLKEMPNYGKVKSVTGKKEFWPWLNG